MAIDCGEKSLVECGENGGVKGNTFAESESNVVPVNCVDGWWWEYHFDCSEEKE